MVFSVIKLPIILYIPFLLSCLCVGYDYPAHLWASLLTGQCRSHPSYIVIYAPGDSLPCQLRNFELF